MCRHIYFWASLTENSVRSHLWIFPLARNLAENFVYPQPINKPVKLLYLCVLWVQVQVRNVIVYSWRFLPLPQIVLIYCILILKTFLFNLLWPVFRAVSRVFHCFKGKKGSWYSLKNWLSGWLLDVRLRYIAQWRKKVDRKWWKKLESGGRKNTLYEQKINSGKQREMTRYTKWWPDKDSSYSSQLNTRRVK